jgi:hypothetical protein
LVKRVVAVRQGQRLRIFADRIRRLIEYVADARRQRSTNYLQVTSITWQHAIARQSEATDSASLTLRSDDAIVVAESPMPAWDITREGRDWSDEAFDRLRLIPEKTEMINGRLYASEEERLTMLALLLENVGIDRAVRLGSPDAWRAAVTEVLGERVTGSASSFALPIPEAERHAHELTLVASLRADQQPLRALLDASSNHWGFEDPVYRFYHQSFKVFALQGQTEAIVGRLSRLVPERPLHPWFVEVMGRGTGREFTSADNQRWMSVASPIVEAFLHARFFLEMAVRYADVEMPPRPLPSGYAALLYLYQLR